MTRNHHAVRPGPCPSADDLERLSLGQLAEADVDRLAGHLEGCSRCLAVLRAVPAEDPLVRVLQAARGTTPEAPDEAVTRLIERLREQPPVTAAGAETPSPGGTAELYAFLAPAEGPDEIGRLGPYRVRRVLGAGGMGVVFEAEDPQLRRVVALKVIRPNRAAGAAARQRFLREARAAAAVTHDHLVGIHHLGEDRGVPYLVMPLLRGETLKSRLARAGRLPVAEVIRIGREAAEGLAAAHARGLVHRDVNPANLWLEAGPGAGVPPSGGLRPPPEGGTPAGTGGRVKVMDFGLAQAMGEALPGERGATMGTLPYIAPEQVRGEQVDGRADLFGLGCVLYRACTGVTPFQGEDTAAVLAALENAPPRPVRELNPEVPPGLAELIGRLLAKDPGERPAKARDVAVALAALAAPQGQPRRRSRKPFAVAAGILVLVTGGLLLALIIIRIQDRDGKETTLTVPEGRNVKLEQGGKVLGTFPSRAAADKRPLGPLDRLDPARIPAEERFAWQPKELVAVLGEHRGWHRGAVFSVAFSADGKWLASGGNGGLVRLWDPETLRLRASLSGHTGSVHTVAFAPDSKTLASASDDRTVRLWDVSGPAPRLRSVLRRNMKKVWSVAFAPDGKTLACGQQDGTVQLWSLHGAAASESQFLRVDKEGVFRLAFAPDSRTLAAGGNGGTLRLWDLSGPEPKPRAGSMKHAQRVNGLAFSPDGKTLASCSWDSTLRLWDVTGAEVRERCRLVTGMPYGRFNALAYARDGQTLAASCADGTVRLWDVGGAEPKLRNGLRPQNTSTDGVYALAFAPDSQTLATGSYDTTIRIWDLSGARPKRRAVPAGHPDPVTAVAFAPDGRTLASFGFDFQVRLWDLAGTEPRVGRALPACPGRTPTTIVFRADGKTLAAGSTGRVRVWDLVAGEPKLRCTLENPDCLAGTPAVLAVHEQTALRSASGPGPGQAVMDAVARTHGATVWALALTADGKTLASGGEHNHVRLWDLSGPKPKERCVLKGHAWRVLTLAFAPDGRTLASGSADRTVRLWDLSAAKPRQKAMLRHDGNVHAVAFAPDGRTLVAVDSSSCRLILWDAASGQKQRELTLPGVPFGVAFAPDGRHLATAHANGTVYILRLEGPRPSDK